MADSITSPKFDSSKAKNVKDGQSTDENAFVTPGKKKKRSLKKIQCRPKLDINLSKGKLKSISTPKNYSFLNVSVQKQTLRANNRVLAQSLARSREELRAANNRIFQLHREQQDILQENNRLHRVAGLKDEEIETEVQKRLQLLMMDMKTNLREISQHMLKSGEILNELHEKCLTYSRPSVSGSRSLSVGNISTRSSDGGLICNTNRRSIYCQSSKLKQPSTHDFLPKADELEMGGFSTKRGSVEGLSDMSLIMEQSTLDDTAVELGEMAAIVPLPAVSESAEHPSLQKVEVGLPRRVLIRRNSGTEKAEKPDTKGDNLQSSSKQKENNGEEVKQDDKLKVENLEKLENEEQNTQTGAKLKGRANTSNSKEDNSDSAPALKDSKGWKEVINPKKRRETFVVPSSVLPNAENHKKELAATSSNFDPMDFENIDDEIITLVSGSPISAIDSENKQQQQELGPSGDGENIKSKRETFYLPNPFKPTKDTIRTPPKISSQEVLAKLIQKQVADEPREQSYTKLWPSLPEEELTTFFNTDMEFTAVIDTKKPIEEGENTINLDYISLKDVTKTGSSKLIKTGKLNSGTENKKEQPHALKAKGKNGSEDADNEKKSSKKVEEKIKGHVELRLAKSGKIVFSASRKQLDGTRMPVPAKPASKSRLKRKKPVIETPDKEPNKIASIFDFHDRTPNVTLEQTDQLKQGRSVYDISLNETAKDEPLPSLKEFKDKLLRDIHAKAAKQGTLESVKQVNVESTKQGTSDNEESTRREIAGSTKSRSRSKSRPLSKLKKADVDEFSLEKAPSDEDKSSSESSLIPFKEIPLVHVEYPEQIGENMYCLPLKGCSDDEDAKPKRRGRSRSRSKNEAVESDNKDDSEVTSSRNRSKSRSRFKRAKNDSDSDEEWKPSRDRSQSRPRSKKTTSEDGSSAKKNPSESCRRRSRSQSSSRETLPDSDNKEKPVSLKPSTRSRSRSKPRSESPSKEEIGNEKSSRSKSISRKAEEAEKIKMIEQTADSIGYILPLKEVPLVHVEYPEQLGENMYCLPLKGCSDDEDAKPKRRGRSRSRSKNAAAESDNKDDSEATSSRNRSKSRSRFKRAKNDSDSDEEWKPSHARSRSRPRSIKTTSEDGSSANKNPSESRRRRSRSRARSRETLPDSDNKETPVSLKPSTRSQSRSRSKPRSESPSKEEIENEKTSRSKSISRKAEEAEKIKIIEQTADSIIYTLPLKGCSDDETSSKKSWIQSDTNSRSRSKSRSKVGSVLSESDAVEENVDSKRRSRSRCSQRKGVSSSSTQEDKIEISSPKSGIRKSNTSNNLKTLTSEENRKKSIKQKDNIWENEDGNIDILSPGTNSHKLLSVSPNSITTHVEVHRAQSDDDLIKQIDEESNSHSSQTRSQEEKVHPEMEHILRKKNGEKFDHCSIPSDKDCSSGATNSDSDSSMRFVTKKRGESLKVDQTEDSTFKDKILEIPEESIQNFKEEIGIKSVKSSKSRTCKSTAKKSRRVMETDTKDSTPKVEKKKEGKSTSKKEKSKDEKENQSLKNIRKRLTMLKYSTSKIILKECSKQQHSNVKESPSAGIRRTADSAFESDINFTDGERQEEFKKPRRAASAVVSYVMPNMRKKLRREDVLANNLVKASVYKSPSKGHRPKELMGWPVVHHLSSNIRLSDEN